MHRESLTPQIIGEIAKDKNIPPYAKLTILAESLPTQKELGRGYYRDLIMRTREYTKKEIIPQKDLLQSILPDIQLDRLFVDFPCGTWSLTFSFMLKKPYISRDDTPFYIIDNPVRKDKVFKIPMISPSQWKGMLHSLMARKIASKIVDASSFDEDAFLKERVQIIQLFGSEKENVKKYLEKIIRIHTNVDIVNINKKMEKYLSIKDIDAFFRAGRFRFYPSFFNDIGLEIINPHDRVKKVGKNPIYFESVPAGSRTTFKLVYVPYDLMGKPRRIILKSAANDMVTAGEAITELLTIYGIGAKISSGFGVTEKSLKMGRFGLKGIHVDHISNEIGDSIPEEPEIVTIFKAENPDIDLTMKVREFPGSKKKKAKFHKIKKANQDYEEKLKKYNSKNEKCHKPKVAFSNTTVQSFDSFESLQNILHHLAEKLNGEANE